MSTNRGGEGVRGIDAAQEQKHRVVTADSEKPKFLPYPFANKPVHTSRGGEPTAHRVPEILQHGAEIDVSSEEEDDDAEVLPTLPRVHPAVLQITRECFQRLSSGEAGRRQVLEALRVFTKRLEAKEKIAVSMAAALIMHLLTAPRF
jgi:hypothetical protein